MDRLKKAMSFSLCFYKWKQRSIKKTTKLWNETKNRIKAVNGGELIKYTKEFMKFRFESEVICLWVKH